MQTNCIRVVSMVSIPPRGKRITALEISFVTLLFGVAGRLGWAFSTTTTHISFRSRGFISNLSTEGYRRQKSHSLLLHQASTSQSIGDVVFLLPTEGDAVQSKFGSNSPVLSPTLAEAAAQLARKSTWFADGLVKTAVVQVPVAGDSELEESLLSTDVLIALGLSSESDISYASRVFEQRRQREPLLRKRQCQFGLDCTTSLPVFVGPFDPNRLALESTLIPWSEVATGSRLHDQMLALFEKWNSDEFVFGLMLFLNQFSGSQVDWVKHSIDTSWEKGPVRNAQEIYAMVSKCGDCISRCVQDDSCRECLDQLTAVDTRDQVASYRTIVSYESELLKEFSFCILQKNNIFNCDASIPEIPQVPVLSTFRGKPLTEDVAKSILVGHLDEPEALDGSQRSNLSWLVACGANEAYDKFPSQHQLFYSAVRGRDLWYDPVFRVQTLNDETVWCKRHYKVRSGKIAGTFRFSVLDNGITSNEFWTIVAVADDLSWIVFHYAGAAGAVGQRYLGGLLCTPDGTLPGEDQLKEVWPALKSAGIEPWELFVVDNNKMSAGYIEAGSPPLDFFRTTVRSEKAKISQAA